MNVQQPLRKGYFLKVQFLNCVFEGYLEYAFFLTMFTPAPFYMLVYNSFGSCKINTAFAQ